MHGDGGFGGPKSENTQGTQAECSFEENTSQIVGKTGSERELTRTGPNYTLPEYQEKGMETFFTVIFFLFLIPGGFHHLSISLTK